MTATAAPTASANFLLDRIEDANFTPMCRCRVDGTFVGRWLTNVRRVNSGYLRSIMSTHQSTSQFRAKLVAAVVGGALLTASCGSSSSTKSAPSTTKTTAGASQADVTATHSVTVWPLAFVDGTPPHGVSSPLEVDLGPSSDKKLRVSFSEDEVSGTGDQWRAAAWNAVTVGTILTGSPLRGKEFTFKLRGRIDGPSAGTLMTIAVIALIRGDKIHDDITMTGTINPDGTTGPVGGIPYKVQGVVQAHKVKMLIPVGLRNSQDKNGNSVDIVQEGRDKGIAVSEVADIYDAYKQFTGVNLPKAGQNGSVSLSERAYQTLKAKVDANIAQVKSDAAQIKSIDHAYTSGLSSTLNDAQTQINQAVKLEGEGLQAGAFNAARQASTLTGAALATGRLLETYGTKGRSAFFTQLNASVAINDNVQALFEELKAFKPDTLSDVSAIVGSYGEAIDALSLANYGDTILASLKNARTLEQEASIALQGAFFKEVAKSLVGLAKDVFDVGRGLGGAKLSEGADVAGTADFFRKAAEANLQAFDTVVVNGAAEAQGESQSQAIAQFEGKDLTYALAKTSTDVIEGGLDRFLEADAKNYAKLGGAIALYVRSAGLIDKYYSLDAQADANGNVTSVVHDQALSSALDLAKNQVERSVSQLTVKQIDPTLEVGSYEIAGVEREGSVDDKLNALSDYRSAFISSRVLAYLGGFARLAG